MSAAGREASGPRTYGTMQYEQKLLQPGDDLHPGRTARQPRRAGRSALHRVVVSWKAPTGRPSARRSLAAERAARAGSADRPARPRRGSRAKNSSRRLWARQPATTTSLAGSSLFSRAAVPRWPGQAGVGLLPDGAGVVDEEAGLLGRLAPGQTHLFEQTGDALGVVVVHLAPERAQVVRAWLHRGSSQSRGPAARPLPEPLATWRTPPRGSPG